MVSGDKGKRMYAFPLIYVFAFVREGFDASRVTCVRAC
jgi:hypothetical protein